MYTAEENYIKIIYRIQKKTQSEANTNTIAEMARTKAASVSDMLKKLANKGMIHYVKYQGVTLTEEGTKQALMIIRKHRLWEVFLVQKMGFKWNEIHEITEQLEHIRSPALIEKLDAFLNYPEFNPHGDPIPDASGKMSTLKQVFLADMDIGKTGIIAGVKDSSTLFLNYLDKIGINIGSPFEITDKISYDQSVEIIADNVRMLISRDVAGNLFAME